MNTPSSSRTSMRRGLLLFICLFTASADGARVSAGFVNLARSGNHNDARSFHFANARTTRTAMRPLCSHNVTEPSTTPANSNFLEQYTTVSEPRLLAADVVSIMLASQLLGLVDVLNDPTFWQEGGFNQPIPAIPSTFSTLVQRDSILTTCWILAALNRDGFKRETILSDQAAIGTALTIWLDVTVLRFAGGWAFAQVTQTDIDVFDIARQCWFAAVLVCSCRYIYSQYNR